MTQSVLSLVSKGSKSTVQLSRGINLSYQSTGVAIYNSTELDRWFLGDFISADYIINAEFGNERETIRATLVATPGQSSITIFGRTNLSRSLINIRADATDSYVVLIVEPASIPVQGSIVSFFSNYAKSTLPVKPLNHVGIVTGASWTGGANLTSLTITIPTDKITGYIEIGYTVLNSLLPAFSEVTSWNQLSGYMTISWTNPTTIQAGVNQQLNFNRSASSLTRNITTEATSSFRSILVPEEETIDATDKNDYLIIKPGSGINISTVKTTKELTISSNGITSIHVAGQLDINTELSNSNSISVVAGDRIAITTNPFNNSLTVSSTGISLFSDDGQQITGFNLDIVGGQGIATTVSNHKLQIINTTTNYTSFIDDNNTSITPTEFASTMRIRQGMGITATITSQDYTYGDNILIENTGVLSLDNKTGAITISSLISSINNAQNTGTYIDIGQNAVAMMYFLRF